ncbi:MAG: type I-U CRISPR-associated helicase/endonuclease Cas3 [Phycisphaeraceae bacterium]
MGFAPYPWQRRLYDRMMADDWPAALDIPTGLGKTSVMAIWLLALANGAAVPRRLIYVVNRRTIVDQASEHARGVLSLLYQSGQRDEKPWATAQRIADLGLSDQPTLTDEHAPTLATLRDALAALSDDDTDVPLAISTLRGELADNGDWRRNPARPAIVVGTVDLLGSDLLFRGYRTAWRSRSFQAGLLGHDALIVHDEVHLTPPFQALLEWIVARQRKQQAALRPLRCMALSATSDAAPEAMGLTEADRAEPGVVRRLRAEKRLFLHETDKLVDAIVERALQYADQQVNVVVFVRSPDDAQKVEKKLRRELKPADRGRLALLTGTIRGQERDALLRETAMRYFLPKGDEDREDVEGAVYLVSTSAGEVGVDLDADHMVADLAPADSLVQRLGRVNRRGGEGRVADVHVYVDTSSKDKDPLAPARDATASLLRERQAGPETWVDASPEATRGWVNGETRTPVPEVLPLTEAGLDALSLTSIAGDDWPIVPNVSTLLHGLVEEDLPQTTVLWRREVELLHDAGVLDVATLRQVFRRYAPLSHERLTVPTHRLVEFLKERVKRRAKQGDEKLLHAAIVGQEATWLQLTAEAVQEDALAAALRHRTLVLPPTFGGLDAAGMLDATMEPPAEGSLDIADTGQRVRLQFPEDEVARLLVGAGEVPDKFGRLVLTIPLDEKQRVSLRFYREVERYDGDEGPPPTVDDHNERVRCLVVQYAEALELGDALTRALTDAAAAHDLGKRRQLWQSAAGHRKPGDAYAKPAPRSSLNWRDLQRYRHEFGSLLDTDASEDLTLHLIASHHGRARPHFPAGMFDPERAENAYPDPAALACRFARLQREHGHWGLAWLEALLRAADRAASSEVTAEEDSV